MQRSKIYLKRKKTLVNILKVHYRKSSNIICHFIQSPRLQLPDGTRKRILWQGKQKKKRKKVNYRKLTAQMFFLGPTEVFDIIKFSSLGYACRKKRNR